MIRQQVDNPTNQALSPPLSRAKPLGTGASPFLMFMNWLVPGKPLGTSHVRA
jgi:hypothetical protein